METTQNRQILSLLLFPLFQSSYGLEDFKKFLEKTLVGDGTSILVCGYERSARPGSIQAWLTRETQHWSGPIALFYWAGPDSVQAASSKLGTFDWKIDAIRRARKVLMVNDLGEPHSLSQYPSMNADGTSPSRPLLLVRTGQTPNILTQRELANHLRTERVSASFPAPPRRRRDETVEAFVVADPKTGQMKAVPVHADPEADRETLPPPPGVGPADIFARSEREDPTQPK